MNAIKKFFIGRNIKKLLAHADTRVEKNHKAKNVLILLDLENSKQKLHLEEVCNRLDIQSQVLGYIKKPAKNQKTDCLFYSLRDISLKGHLTGKTLTEIVNREYDLVLLGFFKPIKPLLLVALGVRAELRIAFDPSLTDFSDIIIQMNRLNQDSLQQELTKYLKAFNKI